MSARGNSQERFNGCEVEGRELRLVSRKAEIEIKERDAQHGLDHGFPGNNDDGYDDDVDQARLSEEMKTDTLALSISRAVCSRRAASATVFRSHQRIKRF